LTRSAPERNDVSFVVGPHAVRARLAQHRGVRLAARLLAAGWRRDLRQCDQVAHALIVFRVYVQDLSPDLIIIHEARDLRAVRDGRLAPALCVRGHRNRKSAGKRDCNDPSGHDCTICGRVTSSVMRYVRSPRGSFTTTSSPSARPSSARPIGEAIEIWLVSRSMKSPNTSVYSTTSPLAASCSVTFEPNPTRSGAIVLGSIFDSSFARCVR